MPFARRETLLLLFGDVALLFVSLWLALIARNFSLPTLPYFGEHVRAFLIVFAISLLIFFIAGLYERRTRVVKRILGSRIVGAQAANTALAAILFFLLPFTIAPKTILALYLAISVVLISVWRFFIVPQLRIIERVPAVLVGEGETVDEVVRLLAINSKYAVTFTHCVAPNALAPTMVRQEIERGIAEGARVVVLDSRNPHVRAALPTLYDLMLDGVGFIEFSTFYENLLDRVPLAHIDHAWLLEHLPARNIPYSIAKRGIDFIGALIGIVFALPFIMLGVLAIRANTAGNAFIGHTRVGRGGMPFTIIKLRTMLVNDHGDPVFQRTNRVTRVGAFLRKTRIDELPQLWNILRGDLSFIGPRPELPVIAAVYERDIPYYAVRHVVLPGLSGWAQIYDSDAPRGPADVVRTARKLSYDIYYLKHRSISMDVAIGLKTLRALASFSGT